MLTGFISQSPLDARELTRSLTRLADSLVVHQKAHRIVFAPHIAGVAFAPDWRTVSPVCQTQTGHIAYLDGEFFNRSDSAISDPEFLIQAITGEQLNRIDGLLPAWFSIRTKTNCTSSLTDTACARSTGRAWAIAFPGRLRPKPSSRCPSFHP